MSLKRLGLLCFLLVAGIILFIKLLHLDTNEKFLNFFARFYFDENYYATQYPEVSSEKTDLFENYVTEGWKEYKNPNANFDSEFYRNMYLLQNKHNLNPLADYVRAKFSLNKRFTKPDQLKKAVTLENPKYYLSLVALFQNEARFLKEWIEFYILIGVEHFYLYNHLSTDNFQEVLQPYINEGIVELRNIDKKVKNLTEWNKLQIGVYSDTVHELSNITEWLIIVDTDEFLFPVNSASLSSELRNYDDFAAVSVDWRIYGTGDVEKIAPDELLIEKLVKADINPDLQVKTIVKPIYVENISHPHFPDLKEGYAQVSENKEYFKGPFLPEETRSIFRINHYWTRDWKFFREHKLARVHVINKAKSAEEIQSQINHLIELNQNSFIEDDYSISKYIQPLKERMKNLDTRLQD